MTYKLPSGQQLVINQDTLYQAPELIFGDSEDDIGIQKMVFKTVKACPITHIKDLTKSIVICGGSTCFNNFDGRLLAELTSLDSKINFGLCD